MRRLVQRSLTFIAASAAIGMTAIGRAEEPSPPDGFRALFNGRDLAGTSYLRSENPLGLIDSRAYGSVLSITH